MSIERINLPAGPACSIMIDWNMRRIYIEQGNQHLAAGPDGEVEIHEGWQGDCHQCNPQSMDGALNR